MIHTFGQNPDETQLFTIGWHRHVGYRGWRRISAWFKAIFSRNRRIQL